MLMRSVLRAQVALLALLSSAPATAQTQGRDPGRAASALVIPIHGRVSFKTVALLRRGLGRATGDGVARVILDIDTPGGRVDRMQEIVTILDLLRNKHNVDTVAYVRSHALSAGAVIALACQRIYMAENSTIGDAVPIVAGGLRDVLEDEALAKMISAFRADVRNIALHHGEDVALLAEAMVDQRLSLFTVTYRDEKDGLTRKKIMPEEGLQGLRTRGGIKILEESPITGRPLTLGARQAQSVRLCEGIANSLADLTRELGIAADSVDKLEPTWSEELAAFLYSIRMFLLVAAVIMSFIALKTPGTGVPEGLAVLCFALFFTGSYLVGLAAVTEILLFVGGLALVIIEIFVVPGTLIAGLAGLVMVIAALFLSLQTFVLPGSTMEGDVMNSNLTSLLLAIGAVIVFSALLSRLMPRIPFFRTLILESNAGGELLTTVATEERATSPLIGKHGAALTDLRPAGKADIEGEPVDVVAAGSYIERGTRVEIVEVHGNRVVVEPRSESGQISLLWLIFMMLCGLLAMVGEVFFPTAGILSVVAAVLSISAIFLAFQRGVGLGLAFLIAVAFLAPIVIFTAFHYLPRTRFGKRMILSPGDKTTAGGHGLQDCVGRTGVVVTPLRPSGTVSIDGKRYDAVTRGESIGTDAQVDVLRVELSQLVVRERTT